MKEYRELIAVDVVGCVILFVDTVPALDLIKGLAGLSLVVFNAVRIYQMLSKKESE